MVKGMEHALTRIMVAVAVIAVVSYAATYAVYYISGAQDINSGNIQERGLQLGTALYDLTPRVIYGVSTGSRVMASAHLGTNNVLVNVTGDVISWSSPKNAIVVRGMKIAEPPSSEFSVESPDLMLMYSLGDVFYMQPKVLIRHSSDSADVGNVSAHLLSIHSCYLSDFTASGLFDLLKQNLNRTSNLYERDCLYDGTVVVYVNGVAALSFDARRGEKIFIDATHYNVKLTPFMRG